MKPDLSVQLGALRMKNPVTTGSGTFGFGNEWADFYDISRLGAITVKAVTLRPRAGNPMPRTHETASGMLNAIGLQNPGLDAFIADKMPYLRRFDLPVIVNIAADCEEEFGILAERLSEVEGVSALECNISCPNQAHGGIAFGVDPVLTEAVISRVRGRTSLPVIAKLSPNVTDITLMARAAVNAGADILSLVNTFVGTAIDVQTRRFRIANRTGGLSGPCIKPIALNMVYRVASTVSVPVIGMGGIATATDAIEFILAGATAVAVGTANFANPMAAVEIVEGIDQYLAETGTATVSELVGKVQACQ